MIPTSILPLLFAFATGVGRGGHITSVGSHIHSVNAVDPLNPMIITTTTDASFTTSNYDCHFSMYNIWNQLSSLMISMSSSMNDDNDNQRFKHYNNENNNQNHQMYEYDRKLNLNHQKQQKRYYYRHKYAHQNIDTDVINQGSTTHTLIPSFMPDIVAGMNNVSDNDEYSGDNEFMDENWFNYDYNNSAVLFTNGHDPDFRLPHMHNITFLLNVSRDIPEKLRILLFGYVLPNLFALTIITNLLIVAVLSQQHMRTPTNLVLLGMAIADLLTLLIPSPWYIYLFTMGHHHESIYPVKTCYIFHWMYEILPPLFHTYSIWLTLLLAGQRYIYVCHFSLARRWCTVPQVIRAMLILLAVAILHQSTRFFDRKFLPIKYVLDEKIFEGCEYHTSEWVIRYFGEDLYYIFYYGFRIIFVHMGPCILLVWLNVLLFRALHRTRKTRKRLLSCSRGTTTMAAGPTSIVTMMMMTQTNNSTRRSIGSIHTNIHNNNNNNNDHHLNKINHHQHHHRNQTNGSMDESTNQNINDHQNCKHLAQSTIPATAANHQIIDCDLDDVDDNDDDDNNNLVVNHIKHKASSDDQHQSQIKDDPNTIFSNSPTAFNRYGGSIQRENSSIKLTHQMADTNTNKIRLNRLDSRSTTVMLIVIVSMFLFLEIPFALTTILHVVQSAFQMELVNYSVLNSIIMMNNFFIIVSYPINFAIYCGMSRQFRITFHQSILASSWKRLHWLSVRFYGFRYFRRNRNKNSTTATAHDNNGHSSDHDGMIDKSFVSAADLAEKRIDCSEIMAAYGNTQSDINNLMNLFPTTNEIELEQQQQQSSGHDKNISNENNDSNVKETDSNSKSFTVTNDFDNTVAITQLLPTYDPTPDHNNDIINEPLFVSNVNNQQENKLSSTMIKSKNHLKQNESTIVIYDDNDEGHLDSYTQHHENFICDSKSNNNHQQQTSFAQHWDQHSEKSYQIDSTMKITTTSSTTTTTTTTTSSKNKFLLETNL
ncbi:hypothetical protein DERF_003001 [Dermatophagoides farinae]|uniref:G-protein coupled receptors family 1 profile domain-containing protein n=1 Tax=Dermatophagoides farinae TaxID=6954 RepID=A0A922IGA6_DERFA|nr:hypothetical protein DERF_003001 [Dermatophagoides farinae]